MAANTCVSTTGAETGTDPNFVVTYKTNSSSGVICYVKYDKGTEASLTLTFETVNPSLHATDKFLYPSLTGTALAAYTMVLTADGNYRIPLPVVPSEKQVICNAVFASGNTGGAVTIDFGEA